MGWGEEVPMSHFILFLKQCHPVEFKNGLILFHLVLKSHVACHLGPARSMSPCRREGSGAIIDEPDPTS